MSVVDNRPTSASPRGTERRAIALQRVRTDASEGRSGGAQPPVAPPRGWGSRQERRDTLYTLAFFGFLGLYAAGFVLIGTYIWN